MLNTVPNKNNKTWKFLMLLSLCNPLTHWGWVKHNIVHVTGSDNGLSPGWLWAIIWTNAGILLIELLGTNFIETLIKSYTFAFRKMHLKMLSGKWRPFCLGLNILTFEHAEFISRKYRKAFIFFIGYWSFTIVIGWEVEIRIRWEIILM